MAKVTKATSMLCCLAIASLSMLSVSASEGAALDTTGHIKGEPAFGVTIPKETTYRDSDGKEVAHPCVDRKIGYQGHFDALYGTTTILSKSLRQACPSWNSWLLTASR